MKRIISGIVLLFMFTTYSFAKDYKLTSPDGKIIVTVKAGPGLEWSAIYDGKDIISSAKAGMILADKTIPGENEMIKKAVFGKINQELIPVVPNKRSKIDDNCNTLLIYFKSGVNVQFRAYNDGVAYRFETTLKNDIIVKNEVTDIKFPQGSFSWYPLEDSFMSHNERLYMYCSLDTLGYNHLASLPTLFVANGVNVLLTESDINDYPGMWLSDNGPGTIKGVHPLYPEE